MYLHDKKGEKDKTFFIYIKLCYETTGPSPYVVPEPQWVWHPWSKPNKISKLHKTHHHCGILNKSLLLQVTKQKSSGKLNTAGPPNVALSQQCTVFLVFCLIEKLGQVQLPSQLKVTYLEEKKQKK